MITPWFSLRVIGPALIGLACLSGVFATALWMGSSQSWQEHLRKSQYAGELLFHALNHDLDLPNGVYEVAMSSKAQSLAQEGEFEQIPNIPHPALVTHLTVNADLNDPLSSAKLKLAIVSPDLRYPLSELNLNASIELADSVGKVTALLATYCSDAVVFISVSDAPWRRFKGNQVWGCKATPRDNRLLAAFLGFLSITSLSSLALSTAAQFSDFAQQLRSRRGFNSADTFDTDGPIELTQIIKAVNEHRQIERQHLAERALVLSGVSHDLGTPATRLKLRAELISDPELRQKFEADIDQMTGIIESVLTYTRAELSTEQPRQMSLNSLVGSVVDDFADVGKPVVFNGTHKIIVEGGQSIFMSRRERIEVSEGMQVILQARPIALRRALSNLIDNALKYGRRAIVSIQTDTNQAHILIEDEGGQDMALDLNSMKTPFERGENAPSVEGFGMGLTIASTIAIEHGGSLSFEPGKNGTIARLTIARG